MTRRWRGLLVGSVALLTAAGCAPGPRPLPTPSGVPAPPEGEPTTAPRGAATQALRADALRWERAGELERASSVLERALRIDPQDPGLWLQLSQLRLAQGELDQAEQTARKAAALAGADPDLAAASWRQVARVRRARGDDPGARTAEARAREAAQRH